MTRIAKIVLVAVSLSIFVPTASADTDPFPGVANGAEVGSRQPINPSTGNPADGSAAISCPAGTGRGQVANATTKEQYLVCTKNWQPQATVDAEAKYRSDLAAAQAAALSQSQAWNTANPGQQKCFQWGPITSPSGANTIRITNY